MRAIEDISVRRQADEVAELLRERIMHRRYPPGASLSQRRLAEDLSVGRAVVAEALRMVQREGLVTVAPPGRGMRVASSDRSIMLSAYALREVMDGLAARLAAGHGGAALVRTLELANEDLSLAQEADDRLRFMRANVAFHTATIEGSDNQLLLTELGIVRSTSRSASLVDLDRLRAAVVEHDAILRAITEGDGEAAEALARAHVRASVAALEQTATGPLPLPLSEPD